jgi:hypothetical protein
VKARTPDDFEVWECNEEALRAFLKCQTQWVVGFGGAVGLNYPAVEVVLRLGFPGAEHAALFDALQAMELAALAVMGEQKK